MGHLFVSPLEIAARMKRKGMDEYRWPGVKEFSCRQMFLKSYTFSKKETLKERAKKFIIKIKEGSAPSVSSCLPCRRRHRRRKTAQKFSCFSP